MRTLEPTPGSVRHLAAATGAILLASTLTGCAELLAQLDLEGVADASTEADGLREALRIGTGRAVEALGRADGYLNNPEVRIPVPEKLEKISRGLRAIGADAIVDNFETSMNRAAEAAAPVARQVFLESIREMTFADAVAILRGREHEATDYFRRTAEPRLAELFRPIVEEKLESVGATRSFNQFVEETSRLPFVKAPALDLNGYVTDEALGGLFLALAREEEKIRRDPLARTTALLKKYFGDQP